MIARPDNDESPFTLEERINTLEEHIDDLYKAMTRRTEENTKTLGLIKANTTSLKDAFTLIKSLGDTLTALVNKLK